MNLSVLGPSRERAWPSPCGDRSGESSVAKKQATSPAEQPAPGAHPTAEQGPVAVMTSSNGHHDGRRLLEALKTLKKGDFSVRLAVEESVIEAAIAEAFNDV